MPALPPGLDPIAAEIATYFRELPRLLDDGHAGRVVLVKGDRVVGVWDTDADAYQAGVDLYGFGPFLAQPVDARDLDRLAPYFPAAGAGGVSA
jgi:hypothetical protein